MPKVAKELSGLAVSRLSSVGLHPVGGVAGLNLQIKGPNARSWILRVWIGGRRREIGLGGFPSVSLAQARDKARTVRDTIVEGRDPVGERAAARSALAAQRGAEITFDECAEKFIAAKSHEWANPKHELQWINTLSTYASPKIGKLLIRDVTLAHVIGVLEPIWTTKTETAVRLRGRIEMIVDWATVRGYRSGENPARWKGTLDKVLPNPTKVAPVVHHPALPWARMGEFVADLRTRAGVAAQALEFAILCASRFGEVAGARWDEFELEAGVWSVPPSRMKRSKEHRVPLSARAVEIVKAQPRLADQPLVFPAPRGGVMSDMTLAAVIKRMHASSLKEGGAGYTDPLNGRIVTQHGFRSSFRDWAGETTAHQRELLEVALAHLPGDQTEAAYWRGDLMEKRRRLMADWAAHCDSALTPSVVVPIAKAS